MMSYFVGTVWFSIFGVLALVALVATLFGLANIRRADRFSMVMPIVMLGASLGLIGATYFAKTHFRVPVNKRALLIDTIHQKRIGVRDSGVQSRPFIGVNTSNWPATKADLVSLSMESGLASAPSAGTHTPLKIGVDFFVDFSNLDIMAAHRDGFTTFDDFMDRYVLPQAANVGRSIAILYTVEEHNSKKDEWAAKFVTQQQEFYDVPNQGYGLRVVPGRAVMKWDFFNEEDGNAYDLANRSNFLVLEKNNQLQAAKVDQQITEQRSAVLAATSSAVTTSWGIILGYMRPLSPEDREVIYRYMPLQANLEYMRLVGDLKPGTIFPPGTMSPVPTFNTGK